MNHPWFIVPAALILLAVLCLLLGCATPPTPEPVIRTVEVRVPVPVRCTPMLSPEPDYPATDEARAMAADIFEGVKLLLAEIILRKAREAELKDQLAACAGGPTS